MNTCIILDGVNGHGVKRMLSTFKEDYNIGDQIPFNYESVKDALNFVVENTNCQVQFYNGTPINVEPPMFVELTITKAEPGVRGDTVKTGGKPATLETGYVIQVPLFVNEGERVRVDTRTGEYMERV